MFFTYSKKIHFALMILNNVILLKPILLININNYVGQQFSVLRTGISILHYIMITLAA